MTDELGTNPTPPRPRRNPPSYPRASTFIWMWLLLFGLWPLVGPYHADLTQFQLGLDYLIHFAAFCVLGFRAANTRMGR